MIGIIGAMKIEVDSILEYMKDIQIKNVYGVDFFIGKILEKDVILTLSGVGKVSSSMTTTILLSNFCVDEIINIGTAGGMKVEQNTLDIVISSDVVQYDFDTSYIDGQSGLGKRFKSSSLLYKKIKKSFEILGVKKNIYYGEILSGDSFVGETSKIEYLIKRYPKAIACEMESGAIAQVCDHFKIPFIVIRSLSDIVYHDNSGIDFWNNVQITSKRSAKMLVEYIRNY